MSTIEERVGATMAQVDRTIAPGDTMYTRDGHYFSVGASALRSVLLAMETVGMRAPRRLLDFGCGYGRVMRVMRAAFPEAELLACDLDRQGVAHCARAFGARPLLGSADLRKLPPVNDVDVIWCGSVLTHLDAGQWRVLLGYFAGALAEGGVAVVTVHGRLAAWNLEFAADYGLTARSRANLLSSYRSRGFGYRDYPGQKAYGISLSKPAWVAGQVLEVPGLRFIGYVEAGWDEHQDVLSVAKDAERLLKRA